jgi:hypothetical protein
VSKKDNFWDDAEVIHAYLPEIVVNERREETCSPHAFATTLAHFSGTEHYHADSGLLLTDGAKWLLDVTQGYALLGVIKAHLPAIGEEEGAFSVVDLERGGTVTIHDGRQPRKCLGQERLDIALPYAVRLYTGLYDRYLVVMLAGEY